MHEIAHAIAANTFGYTPKSIQLLPYGARLSIEGYPKGKEGAITAAAGPAFSLLISLTTIAFWWIFPATYNYTAVFCAANLFIAVFNLLPLLPLDGGRVILCLAKNKESAKRRMRFAAYVLSFAMVILCAVSAVFKFNLSLGVVGVFLFYGAAFEAKKEEFVRNFTAIEHKKNGICEKKCYSVSADTSLLKLLKHIKSDSITTFDIVDNGNIIAVLDEVKCEKLFLSCPLTISIKSALTSQKNFV